MKPQRETARAIITFPYRKEGRNPQSDCHNSVITVLDRLAVRRGKREVYGLPGGQLERGETPEQAMVREVREELGIQIKAATKLETYQSQYARHHLFLVEKAVGEISINTIDDISEVLGLGFLNAGLARQIPPERMQGHVRHLVGQLLGRASGLQKDWPLGRKTGYSLDKIWFRAGHKCFYSWNQQLEVLRRGGNFNYRGPEPYFI